MSRASNHRAASCLLTLLVALIGACRARTPHPNDDVPARFVGTKIIDNPEPAWPAGKEWTIDSDPISRFGPNDTGSSWIRWTAEAVLFPDGRFVTTDGENPIRVFDTTGRVTAILGRKGDGPGEFAALLPRIEAADDTTLLIWDEIHARLTWYHLSGRLDHEARVAGDRVRSFDDFRSLRGDGAMLFAFSARDGSRRPAAGLLVDSSKLAVIRDSLSRWVDYGHFVTATTYWEIPGMKSEGDPFFSGLFVTLWRDPNSVAVASQSSWAIELYGPDGRPSGLIRAKIPRLPIPHWMRDSAHGRFPVPDSLPAIRSLQRDSDGDLWVGRSAVREGSRWIEWSTAFDVISPAGRWLGTVRLPGQGIRRLIAVGRDHVLIETAVAGENLLTLHRISKP